MLATGKNKAYHSLSLSIRLRTDGFSFFVCDLQAGTLMRGEHFTLSEGETLPAKLAIELSRSDYFNRQINQAFVMSDAPSTIVPLENFRRDEVTQLYAYIHGQQTKKQRVAYTIMPHLEAVELFAIDSEVEDAIVQYYPTARFFGSQAMLIERLARYTAEEASVSGHRLFCYSTSDAVTLVAAEQSQLLFVNTYAIANLADAVYFILGAWKQLALDACEDTFVMLGQQPDNALCQELAAYIANITALQPGQLFSDMPLSHEQQVPLQLMALLLNRF